MKVRIKFAKYGSMKFIGHLDLMRYFQKVFRMSGIDVKLSQGYSKHQIMSFASPLGIGMTTEGDYMDVELEDKASDANSEDGNVKDDNAVDDNAEDNNVKDYSVKDNRAKDTNIKDHITRRLNDILNDEIRVVDVLKLPDEEKTSMSLLRAADYEILVKPEKVNNKLKSFLDLKTRRLNIGSFMEEDNIEIRQVTKKSERTINLKKYIYLMTADISSFASISAYDAAKNIYRSGSYIPVMFMRIASGSVINIRPDQVVNAFFEYTYMPDPDPPDIQIHRLDMFADLNADKGMMNEVGGEKMPMFVPLSEYR